MIRNQPSKWYIRNRTCQFEWHLALKAFQKGFEILFQNTSEDLLKVVPHPTEFPRYFFVNQGSALCFYCKEIFPHANLQIIALIKTFVIKIIRVTRVTITKCRKVIIWKSHLKQLINGACATIIFPTIRYVIFLGTLHSVCICTLWLNCPEEIPGVSRLHLILNKLSVLFGQPLTSSHQKKNSQ